MTIRGRICSLLIVCAFANPPARALFNMNQGKDLIFVTGAYGFGYDSNVFTRAESRAAFTHTASVSTDYSRLAGLIGVTVNATVFAGRFDGLSGQDFLDPSVAVALRKRYGRTTGSLALFGRRESQPDPDAGERTRSWNFGTDFEIRYPVNDRYYLTNRFRASDRQYLRSEAFSDLSTFSDAIALNYIYTSKLDLNAGYTFTASDTSKQTTAYDQSFTLGATGSILPKLGGTIRVGVQRRESDSPSGGREGFGAITSSTSLKWAYSRKLALIADLNKDFATTSTDISVNRASAALHATASVGRKGTGGVGVTYLVSDYLGKAGAGRRDGLIQFDATWGIAITSHIRTSLAYLYMDNRSNAASAEFVRHTVSLSILASY